MFDQKHHKLYFMLFVQNKRFSDLQATFKRPVLSDGEQHGLKTSHEFKLSKKGLEGWSESEAEMPVILGVNIRGFLMSEYN